MSHYTITVSGAELDVIILAIARIPAKKLQPERPAAKRGRTVKPPTLPRGGYTKLAGEWAAAVASPPRWHDGLQHTAARATGRRASDIARAWGIV